LSAAAAAAAAKTNTRHNKKYKHPLTFKNTQISCLLQQQQQKQTLDIIKSTNIEHSKTHKLVG